MLKRFVLPALILMLPLTGCAVAAVGAVGAVGLAAAKDKSLGEAVDDTTIGTEIKAKLVSENARGFSEVDVEVVNRLVLLTGRVNTPEERVRAEGIAWTSSRAEDVANEIRIEPTGGFLANVVDEVISARVRSRLIGSSKVKSVNFNIETYNGVVYLMGLARTTEELQRAAEEASIVRGVKQVVSYVRVIEPRRQPPMAPNSTDTPYQTDQDATYPQPDADGELLGANYL